MLNSIELCGRIVRDPELRRTGSGVAVCNFTIACDRDFKNDSGERDTDFFDIIAWRHNGEFAAKYLKKGQMVAVSGRLETRKWTDKEGNSRKVYEINATNVYGLEKAPEEATGSFSSPAKAAPDIPEDFGVIKDDDTELPF